MILKMEEVYGINKPDMEDTHKNLDNYRKGKEPLKNAVLQHPEGNPVHDFMKKSVERNFWVTPFNDWAKKQKTRKK